jgi:hypothetical protein
VSEARQAVMERQLKAAGVSRPIIDELMGIVSRLQAAEAELARRAKELATLNNALFEERRSNSAAERHRLELRIRTLEEQG